MQVRLAPMKTMKPPFTDPRCDMIDPKVQRHGDVALLTFNLVNYGKLPDAPERVLARWNSTEVYTRPVSMTAELMTLQVRNRRQWRAWLAKHHPSSPGVWLVFY